MIIQQGTKVKYTDSAGQCHDAEVIAVHGQRVCNVAYREGSHVFADCHVPHRSATQDAERRFWEGDDDDDI